MESQQETNLIFWGAGTARTIRPIWVAEELGLSYQLKPIGPRTGETQTPEYTELNPKQKVPFCVDGDLKLSETIAICRYLINKYGSVETLNSPGSIEEQAKEDEWLAFIYGELDETSLYVMRRHGALSEIYGEAPAAMEAAEEYVKRQLNVINKHMQNRDYVLNDRFSLPDIFLTTCLNWVNAYEIEMPTELENYRARIVQRVAYVKAEQINKPK
ncbi:MAG: glutathione S-transferase family protein [Gammaproteobacteria bacterium]|nr:glutathione S-transferase family protein [Gammaproteobacteria bacterium]MDD9896020.1 glutathione S-transferase family protein [Gammaproteobacteria bacterium]MDD9959412.1 glutathione S-transferase family protein [Gammaproteobacteria bacterium]